MRLIVCAHLTKNANYPASFQFTDPLNFVRIKFYFENVQMEQGYGNALVHSTCLPTIRGGICLLCLMLAMALGI